MNITDFIKSALEEDVKDGDHTSLACLTEHDRGEAKLIFKEDGILAGVEVAKEILQYVDKTIEVECFYQDGDSLKHGDLIMDISGSAQNILTAERLLLNCMQRMSGIATLTKKYVKAIEGTGAKVLDTRKTTPGFRWFEKEAVKIGGGTNHRFGLFDLIMIKDNHIDFAGGITNAINATKEYLSDKNLHLKIEVEARNIDEVKEILATESVDRIMLDNFTPSQTKEAVDLIADKVETESSGGITLETIRSYAESGVGYISVGALTHAYKSLDISLVVK